jgi:hypothetical protein
MAIEVRVSGAASLHELAARMRAEGQKSLSRQMSSALTKAADPLKAKIKEEASEVMPRDGGYQATFDKSLRFRVGRASQESDADVTLTTYADGTSERRDIRALNKGNLRHPVWGRSRPGARKGERHTNPWAVTTIRSQFWDRGVAGAMDEAEKQMLLVIDEYAHRLLGGE